MRKKWNRYIKCVLAGVYPERIVKVLNSTRGRGRIIFIGSPVHSNLGDHLIAVQCISFLRTCGYKCVIEIPEYVYQIKEKAVHFNDKDILFISGGGWMSDIYEEDNHVIASILTKYKKNHIVIFPQTIYYRDKSNEKTMSQILNDAINTIVCVREENSYSLLTHEMKIDTSKCMLLPDIGMTYLYNKIWNEKSHKIGVALRSDLERKNSVAPFVVEFSSKLMNWHVSELSTIYKRKYVKITERDQRLKELLREFSSYNLIITDRLHAMIFALLSGTKCIVFDNVTKKVSGVYKKWLKDNPNIMLYDKEYLDRKEIEVFLNEENKEFSHDFKSEFNQLRAIIGKK